MINSTNPYVFFYEDNDGNTGYSIGFKVPYLPEPLWWIGTGFKNLNKVRADATSFASKEEANQIIKSNIINFIKKYRSDQVELIIGW